MSASASSQVNKSKGASSSTITTPQTNERNCYYDGELQTAARIPWLPKTMQSVAVEDHKYFQRIVNCPSGEGSFNLELYWIMNHTFPFFLPKR